MIVELLKPYKGFKIEKSYEKSRWNNQERYHNIYSLWR